MKKTKDIKITVVGSGYVGMSMAVLLSKNSNVIIFDIDNERVKQINNGKSPIEDKDIDLSLKRSNLSLRATNCIREAYSKSQFIIIATPTDYNPITKTFDTKSVDMVVEDSINLNKDALIIIKSTVPIGYTKSLQQRYKTNRVIFSPEFLREGKALYDNLYPSRIIIGSKKKEAKRFAALLKLNAIKDDIKTIYMDSSEAESVKLFSNSYLAMRVAFFNELDTFSLASNMDVKSIIEGISFDPRIGEGYNNPSFGYGGYCLPKDTKQLEQSFIDIPQTLISAIVSSNQVRKEFISKQISKLKLKKVGIYRLIMKTNSDNFRESSIKEIIDQIDDADTEIIIYEPLIKESEYQGLKVIKSLKSFKEDSDMIIANRKSKELIDVASKVFTRDIYGEN